LQQKSAAQQSAAIVPQSVRLVIANLFFQLTAWLKAACAVVWAQQPEAATSAGADK
jgi:hypothetical protein